MDTRRLFYFHSCENGAFVEDDIGARFASVEEAHAEAIEAIREMVAEDVADGRLPDIENNYFEIWDEDRNKVLTVRFTEAVRQ